MVQVDERAPFHRRRPWVCCCGIALCIILLIVIIIIILAFTVFKPKDPEITVSNIELQDVTATLSRSGLIPTPSVNVTLSLDISVHNPNRASVKYSNSSAMVYYYDDEVAVVPIPAGVIGSHGTSKISTTLVVLADQLVTNSHLLGDFLAGSLPFETRTKLSGHVKVLFIRRHIDISSVCSISISIANSSITNQDCQNKVNL